MRRNDSVEAEKIHRTVFEHSPLGMIYFDKNGKIKDCNDRVAAILGGLPSDFTGRDFLSAILNKKFLAAVVRASQGSETQFEGYVNQLNSEKRVYIQAWLSGVRSDNGNLIGVVGIVGDITKQRALETELETSRRTFSTLLGNLPGMVYRCGNDKKRTMKFVSEGCYDLTGYRPLDLIANKKTAFIDIIMEDDRSYVWGSIQEALSSVNNFRVVYRIKTAGGDTKWIWEQGCGVYDGDDKLEAVEGFITDISDLKRSEHELVLSEERFSKAFDSNPGMMAIIRLPELVFLAVNESTIRNIGYSREELLGKTLSEINPFADDGERDLIFRNAMEQKTPLRNLEVKIRKKNDEIITGLLSSEHIMLDGAECLLFSAFDITERQKSEKALRKNEERFRLLAENAQDIIFRMRILPVPAVEFISPSVHEITGYTPEEYYENTSLISNIVHQEDKPYFEELLKSPVLFPDRLLMRCLHKSGQLIWMEMRHSLILDDKNRIEAIEGVIRDITESKKADEALRNSEERFRKLFEDSPVAFLEEDFTEIKKFFQMLENYGVPDIKKYLIENPAAAQKCVKMIKVINVNKMAVTLYGAKNKKELIENSDKIFEKETYGEFLKALYAVADNKTIFETETVNRTLKGDKKYVVLKWLVVPGHETQYSRILVSVIDITHRKLAEQALQIKQEVLQSTLKNQELIANLALNLNAMTTFRESINSFIENIGFTLRIDMVSLCRFNPGSERFHPIASWSKETDAGNRELFENVPCFNSLPITQKIKDEEMVIFSDIPKLDNKSGDIFKKHGIHAFAMIPVTFEGKMYGVLCFFQQSGRKWKFEDYKLFETLANLIANAWERQNLLEARLEAERKKAEADQLAERAARLASLGTLTAGIAHEINQPLAALKMVSDGSLYWIKKNKKVVIEDVAEDMNEISEQASRIDKIVKHMRSLAKPDKDVRPELADVNEIIHRVFMLIGMQLSSHRVKVDMELDKKLPLINTFPTMLEQVIINLIINAMQALDEQTGEKKEKSVTVKNE